ncbi:probable multidrug resistance-associated protein lethal(2)03659 [Leptinotarsa decemlineata]|uniref:probable multidrug resistance-associated protein lethal(2)03659 n=1 Tax=Leptinotarsa decemlineata TaxID=7539 RepID=UPI003D306807
MDASGIQERPRNPRQNASILSIITFAFTFPFFKKSIRKDLEEHDVYENLTNFSSKKLGEELLACYHRNPKNPSIFRTLLRCYAKRYLLFGLMHLIVKMTLTLVQPRAMSKFIAYFQLGQSSISKTEMYLYAVLLIFINVANALYTTNYTQFVIEEGIKMRTALTAMLYRKTLNVGSDQLPEGAMGKVVTLISKDVFVFEQAVVYINEMWIHFIEVAVLCCLIYGRIGFSVFSGVIFLLIMTLLQCYIGRKSSLMRRKSAKSTDERIQITTETLSAIKIIKLYCWEKFFGKKINILREKELKHLAPIYYLQCIVIIMSGTASTISFLLILITYIWNGNFMDTETLYYVDNCFFPVKMYFLTVVPYFIHQSADVHAAIKRISAFLSKEEVHSRPLLSAQPGVYLNNVTVQVNGTKILDKVSLSVEKGLYLITGGVGSGKTSLLKTILGDCSIISGQINVSGSYSYAAEDPWVFPSTIRQNILFGQEYEIKRYNKVLSVCELEVDLGNFPDGDQTPVGEKGVSLSKGQQARISLARAVYKDSDIYLIDDCLTHLDPTVNTHIFKSCIMEFLKYKTVLFVTHNMEHIKLVRGRNVLFMKDGRSEKEIPPIFQNSVPADDSTKPMDELISNGKEITKKDVYEEGDEKTPLLIPKINKKNIYHETKKNGNVAFSVYLRYYRFAGGIFMVITLLLVFSLAQVAASYCEKLLSQWVNMEPSVTRFIKANLTDSSEYSETLETRNNYLRLFSIIQVVALVLVFSRTYMTFFFSLRASKNLHKSLNNSVLNSFMTFFDGHYIGNIINRFSKDLSTVDEVIPMTIYEVLRSTLQMIAVVVMTASVSRIFLLPAGFLLVVLSIFQWYYLKAGRSIKRLDSSTRSPMIGHLNATLDGITTVRAFGNQSILTEEFDKHQDHFTSANYSMNSMMRALGLYASLISSIFPIFVIIKFAFFSTGTKAGDVGMAINLAFGMASLIQWSLRKYADLENNMTATERILEYTDIARESLDGGNIKENWPREGSIEYRDLSLTYSLTNQHVLKSMSFVVQPKERIGIVGRTGAGKSSIISSLFRLYQTEGSIVVDGVDIKTLSLEFLRSNISIIPQDPILFSGVLRSNIDPAEEHSDESIWKALNAVGATHFVKNLGERITENGLNYSFGQKQLICLARALIRKNKIIVLDEATASVDSETCRNVQAAIRREFADCTILSIAHRLNTVMDSDRIMVVDEGMVIEFDSPDVLLENENGVFHSMVKEAGLLEN